MVVLLFGPPGCGKGTQAAFIADRFGIPAISTGEIFRAECKAGTRLGKLACAILRKGGLIGDDIANQIVAKRIRKADCRSGFLLDGYPRTVPQAEFLSERLRKRRLEPIVIHLDVPAEALVTRISARRQCPSCLRIYNVLSQPPRINGICDDDGALLIRREDDTEAVILQRLEAYEKLTGPVLAYYRNSVCHHVDGNRPAAEIWQQIERLLDRPRAKELPQNARLLFQN